MSKIKNPSRREFVRTTSVGAVAGALGVGASPAKAKERSHRRRGSHKRPNILLMLVDEMRYPPIYEGAGAKRFRAEYLRTQDVLRARGVEFHRHYAASTACSPSRASLFTGQYPSLHGVTNTTGAAKEAIEPDTFWLDPGSVPTLGDYFRAGGYRTFYKGKWHVSDADLQIPGTHNQVLSYNDEGRPDPEKELLYLEADRLGGFGFSGWIGPEPHGKAPLNTGSSPATGQGRDVGFATQSVDLIEQLNADHDDDPWLMVSSFVNPHDIALWGYVARRSGQFNFTVEDDIPGFEELFDTALFQQTLTDDLSTKPTAQESYQSSYHVWMQGVPPVDYFRFYYQLQKQVDAELMRVYRALRRSRFFNDTIIVFTSDHGDLLGAHRYMHQKWYQAYEEALRVPLIISNSRMFHRPEEVHSVTSHIDLLPTLLGLAGLDLQRLNREVARGHSDPLMPVGRNLQPLVVGKIASVSEPIYFMTDDDPSRGLDQDNFYGIAFDSVMQPNHIESVIVEIDGEVWKYSRYFDNPQFWSDPPDEDIVTKVDDAFITDDPNLQPGTYSVPATDTVKFTPAPDEHEMYNVTQDPMELQNLIGVAGYAAMEAKLAALLDEQRKRKRLYPISGPVPGQP